MQTPSTVDVSRSPGGGAQSSSVASDGQNFPWGRSLAQNALPQARPQVDSVLPQTKPSKLSLSGAASKIPSRTAPAKPGMARLDPAWTASQASAIAASFPVRGGRGHAGAHKARPPAPSD